MKTDRSLPELEGVRGALAGWVAVSHAIIVSGLHDLPPGLRPLMRGEYAVSLFIMLSGLVISKNLLESPQSYGAFLLRRFLRLYPVYLVCLGLGIAARPLQEAVLRHLAITAPPAHVEWVHWDSIKGQFWHHLAAHLTLLHGAIPDAWLPWSSSSLLAAAWSLSLEWQFYLVAPLLALCIRHFPGAGLFGVVAVAVALQYHWAYDSRIGFLPVHAIEFAIGILSYRLLSHLAPVGRGRMGDWFVAAAPVLLFVSWNPPLALWLLVMGALLADDHSRLAAPIRRVLLAPWLQTLGRLSYATYLVHFPCLWVVAWALQTLMSRRGITLTPPQTVALLAPLTIAVTLPASILLHRWVELPGIRWGRRFSEPRPPLPVNSAPKSDLA